MKIKKTFSALLRQKKILPTPLLLLFCLIFLCSDNLLAQTDPPEDTTDTDTDTAIVGLPFPFEDNSASGIDESNENGLYLKQPSNIQGEFVYDPKTDTYVYKRKMGEMDYRSPEYMTMEEYKNYDMEKSKKSFFREKAKEEDMGSNQFRPKLYVENKAFDRIFGGNTIDIRPQGSAELTFGVNTTRRDNPAIPENQRRTTNFDFDEKIQLNVVGSVGDKLKISTSYNTEATFDFENQTKIEYTGYEDEIIQKIELGNVALPLQGSLIQGSQTLFGVKTVLKFGRMRITSIYSQEKGERSEVNVQGGAQTQKFKFSASEYEDYQHYFLGHYFRDRYNQALSDLPNVVSAFRINRVEVWVTQTGGQIQNARNIIAFADLGEGLAANITAPSVTPVNPNIADNYLSNNLYTLLTSDNFPGKEAVRSYTGAVPVLTSPTGLNMSNGRDFEAYEGVLLQPSEYTINAQLGYISLNRKLNPEDILGVAYEYLLNGRNYRVGEMSNNVGELQKAIYVKLLKSSFTNVGIPMWDLMMKNVYYLNSYGISKEDFRFEIWYLNTEQGVELPFIAEGPINGQLLLQVMGLDNLDYYNAKHEDGEFDYIEGITINPNKGRVYFPVLEPFGDDLRAKLISAELGDKYAYDSLYTTTRTLAQLDANKNRFFIRGSYKSSSGSEIRLNKFNIPEGSVVVTAGGSRLTENVDYTVDYNLGTVKILNTGLLESNTPIKVSLESNSFFNIQTRTLMGSRVDYDFSENLKVGGTVLNLTERPLTYKVNIGDEAISNTIVGLDGSYSTEAPILTKIADALPLFDTKEKSKVSTSAEFAYLIPGNARAISKNGIAYIDDFEGSQSQTDLKQATAWRLASTPRGQPDLFPEGDRDDISYGFNRANLSWYYIDPLFFNGSDSRLPGNITNEMRQNHYMRQVLQQEIFPNRSLDQNLIGNISILDMFYNPLKRGQYNFDPPSGTAISGGLNPADGTLNNPETRWGGMMRDIPIVDFEATNIEFLQFWVMDPFIKADYEEVFNVSVEGNDGELYFNFGEVAEDILKDNQKSYENGFPFPGNDLAVDQTVWGRVPVNKTIVNAFDNSPDARPYQDIGYDGLSDDQEVGFHQAYLQSIQAAIPNAYQSFLDDPAADNFKYFRDESDSRSENIVQRYGQYNGVEGNSPVSTGSFTASSYSTPDIEDINRDNTLNTKEAYYQYRIPINTGVFNPDNVGENYVTNVVEQEINGKTVRWYQFKVPLRSPDKQVGQIRDFKSIRFVRMFMKGFEKPIVMRFAKLELIRGEWRRYFGDLRDDGDYIQGEPDETQFTINAVNVEENSSREPIHYVLPSGISREVDYGTANLRQLNEQSLALFACGLNDGATKAAYRNLALDIRQYKKLKMYVHLEDGNEEQHVTDPLTYGEVSLILRMGADFEDNYYEYEVPLHPTAWGDNSSDGVWPPANNIEVALDDFSQVKLNRDAAGNSRTEAYSEYRGGRIIRVKGSPNIATIKVMMIGVKNPKAGAFPDVKDDGKSKCATVWVNELRVSDFNNEGGWATTASVSANLADLATMRLSGNMSTPGFGSINQKLNERQQVTKQAYDFSSNWELGKFTSNTFSIPMYFRYSESWEKPRYVPLNPDVELSDIESSEDFTRSEKDSIKKSAITYLNSRSINFTNVRLNYPQGKNEQHIYDIQNFSVTYAYNLDKYRDVNLEYENKTEQKGMINWAYSAKPKNYQPLSRAKWLKSKHLRILKDFNFYLAPKQYGVSTTVERGYNEKKLRQTNPFYDPRPYYRKKFNWDRSYMLKHDFTKNLRFSYDATNNGYIRETDGKVDKNDTGYTRWKDTVLHSISEFGTNLRYNQNYTLEYTVPINKFPWFDWTNLNVSYNGGYYWDRAAIGSEKYGHTIRNTSAIRYSSSLDMTTLYNKVDYLKRLGDSERGRNKNQILKSKKKDMEKKGGSDPPNKGAGEAESEDPKKKEKDKDKKKDDKYRPLNPLDYLAKIGTSIKEISGSYTQSTGTIVPGYLRETSMMGYDSDWDAPGLPFILGQKQDTNYVVNAERNGWLVRDNTDYRYTFQNNQGDNYTYRLTLRPVNNLRIVLNGAYNYNIATNMGYTWSDSLRDANNSRYSGYQFDNAVQTGSFSVSTITYKTSFEKFDRTDYSSPAFERFNEFRPQASDKLASQRVIEDPGYSKTQDSVPGYYKEYGPTQQDVLISSFVSAYKGDKEVNTKVLDFKRLFPLPNWDVNYDGLGKLAFLQKYFQSIVMRHAYRSNYNISSFTTNNLVYDGLDSVVTNDVATGNKISKYQISSVSITEMFSPFFKIDFNFKNGLLLGYEFKRDRNVSLSTINNQITEVRGREHIVSVGYTFRNVRITFTKNTKADPKNIITRIDISSRDNYTILRSIGAVDNSQPGNGQNVLSIKFTADLAVNPKFNIRAFYDRIVTKPFISNSFPTASSNYGISLRFSLAQ